MEMFSSALSRHCLLYAFSRSNLKKIIFSCFSASFCTESARAWQPPAVRAWSSLYVSTICTRQSSSLGLLFNFICFRVPLFSENCGVSASSGRPILWRWDCLSFASVWRGASVTAHHTMGFRFLGWQELQHLFCSWGFFLWLAHLDATQASCVL